VPDSIDTNYIGCIMCDRELGHVFNLTVKQSSGTAPPSSGSTRGGMTSSRGGYLSSRGGSTFTTGRSTSSRGGSIASSSGSRGGRTQWGSSLSNMTDPGHDNKTRSLHTQADRGRPPLSNIPGNVCVCSCGQPARQFTVRKDGPNQGKRVIFMLCDISDGNDIKM